MDKKFKVVIDNQIPFLEGVFEPYAEVSYVEGNKITRTDVADADALIVRTRTNCDRYLLEGSNVKIIASASVGMEHIDEEYCDANGIEYYNAPGTSAMGVMQYVFSALYGVASRKAVKLDGKTFGIIGAGNIGRTIAKVADYLGFSLKIYDPVKINEQFADCMCQLDELLAESDIVTIHTSLRDGYRNMADKEFFGKMKKGAFFINACRGEFVVEDDLMAAIPKFSGVILDSWQNEPYINKALLDLVDVGTPHISGYSLNVKLKGSAAVVRNVARRFGIEELYDWYPVPEGLPEHEPVGLALKGKNQGEITAVFQYNYPIFTDDFMFRLNPEDFVGFRANYKYRREIYIEELN